MLARLSLVAIQGIGIVLENASSLYFSTEAGENTL